METNIDYKALYEEARERAKQVKLTDMKENVAAAEYIFPDLKEIEDERMSNIILEGFKNYSRSFSEWNDVPVERIIAYLERQKEPENVSASTMAPSCWQKEHKPIEFKNDELVEIIKGEFEGFRRLLKKKGIDYEPQRGYWEGFARLFDSSAREYVKEQKPVEIPNLRTWKKVVDIVLTEHNGIGQYLDDPDTERIAKRLEERFSLPNSKPAEKQDYSGLTDFERAIHRGFLCAGVENVPVTIIKETAQDCLVHLPAEWSEEDEYCKQQLIAFCENCMQQDANAIRCADWLKSLRPQPHWKPSEEQMKTIWLAIQVLNSSGHNSLCCKLNTLRDELLKLK